MALSDRQRDRIALGLDPENEPPYMDQPACERCGCILTRSRWARLCASCMQEAMR